MTDRDLEYDEDEDAGNEAVTQFGRRPGYSEIPDHVRRVIDRDGDTEFTPPSFERWLGRIQMLRTLAAMVAFILVWLTAYAFGHTWEAATIRGIVASIVFYFFAWAAGLFIFGEMYDAEVRAARIELEEKERERARRIEEYYRERLRAQAAERAEQEGEEERDPVAAVTGRYGTYGAYDSSSPGLASVEPLVPPPATDQQQRRAA